MKLVLVFYVCIFTIIVVAQEKIKVYRNGNILLVKSHFSQNKDIVLRTWRIANEFAYLVPKGSSILEYDKGELIHNGGDDFAPYDFSGYGYLGGNHGSSFGRKLNIPNHRFVVKDIGTSLNDEQGGIYYIMKIIDENNILIHPYGGGKIGFPHFKSHKKEKLFRNGIEVKLKKSSMMQMLPGIRVNDIAFLVNGKTLLADKTVVECDFVNHVVDYDIVMPDAVVEMVKQTPGKEPDMIAKELPALLNSKSIFSYQPNGACVIYQKNKVTHAFKQMTCYGTIMKWKGSIAEKKTTKFYIPKLKPFKARGFNGTPGYQCDFSAVYKMPKKMNVSHSISKLECLDENDLPDRFIRITGNENPELGVVVGYSLIKGSTAKENKGVDRNNIFLLWKSKKLYPTCFTISPQKGDEKNTVIYRQYFDPQLEPDATSFYHHKEGGVDVVYMDFHKTLKNKRIKLPAFFVDKKITVVEKTPSVVLHTNKTVPHGGLILDVNDNYGYLVIKFD